MAIFTYWTKNIGKRENFGKMLNALNLTESAVEIGTHRGIFADAFLQHWNGQHFYCVDIWEPVFDDVKELSVDRNPHYMETVQRLEKYKQRMDIHILKMTSEKGSFVVPDNLDFVYIDANHYNKYVRQDIALWWPKLKPGGILAGHDYDGDWEQEVRPAVDDFVNQNGLKLYLIAGDAWSWYVRKPEEIA